MSVPKPRRAYSDRARRASDIVNGHLLGSFGQARGRWVALRLSDGGSDGAVYDRKADAVRHQLHPKQCAYVCIPPDGMDPRGAELYLRFMEGLYSVGADLADPDRQVQMPATTAGMPNLIRAVKRGDIR